MKRSAILLCLMTGIFLLLSGCFFRSPDELYALPQPSEDYQKLKAKIDEVSAGAETAAPQSGRNTQAVQLVDLDGDGALEAVAFFQMSGEEKPLKIYIFKQMENEEYEVTGVIEGEGTAINSIAYENLGGGVSKEIIVSWRISEKVHTLVACSLEDGGVTELMRTGYSRYLAMDIDQDNESEILVIQVDPAQINSRVELYDYDSGTMMLRSDAPLSAGAGELDSCRSGFLRDYVPALFVSSDYGESGLVTDLFICRDGKLENITRDPVTGQSSETIRLYTAVSLRDINGDNILELPQPMALPSYNQNLLADDFWTIRWRQYDSSGTAWPVFTTYHNVSDGWYLRLPDEWEGKFTISRDDSVVGERSVIFSLLPVGEGEEPVPFLVIYKLTGTNQVIRSQIGNRFTLLQEDDAIYAAEFLKGNWDCGLDESELAERFDLIRTEWSTGY